MSSDLTSLAAILIKSVDRLFLKTFVLFEDKVLDSMLYNFPHFCLYFILFLIETYYRLQLFSGEHYTTSLAHLYICLNTYG